MPPVGVIVDVVIAAPEENGIVVVAHVLVGQQNIAGQRAEEGVHFAVESVMEFLQKSIVVLLLFRQAASFAVGGELFRKSFFQERIVFPSVEFDEADVLSVIRFLNNRSKVYDPDKEGINIVAGFDKAVADRLNKVTMSFSRIPMSEVLRYLCQDVGLKYKVDDGSIFIGPTVDEMQTQSFPVRGDLIVSITGRGDGGGGSADAGGMPDEMGMMEPAPAAPAMDEMPPDAGGGEGEAVLGKIGEGTDLTETGFVRSTPLNKQAVITAQLLKNHFSARGVRFDAGSSIAYDRRANKLIVRNTVENLRRLDELLRQ